MAEKKKEKSSSTNDPLLKKGSRDKFDVSHGYRRYQSQGAIRVGQDPPAYPPSVHKRNSLGNSEMSLPPRSEHPLNSLRGRKQPDLSEDLRDELVGNIESILRPCTETPQTNLKEINDKVSCIYRLVETAVVDVLEKVKMRQGGSATEYNIIKYAVMPPRMIVGVIDEPENFAVSNSSLPTISPTPSSSRPDTADSVNRPDTTDSVKTNASGPHSASTQHSILSTGNERTDIVNTKDAAPINASSKHTSRDDDDNTITDNTSLVAQGGAHVIVTEGHDFEINCNCQHSFLAHQMILYLVLPNTPTGSDTLKTYCLDDCNEGRKSEISSTKFCATTCKLFYFNNVSLLIGKLNNETWTLNLYQLNNTLTSWNPVPHSKFSISVLQFNLENSVSISHKGDGVIVVSVIYDHKKYVCITFHVFSQTVSGKNWRSTISQPLSQFRKCEIQSCIIISSDIYCSLVTDTGAHVYKFDLMLLQQNRKDSSNVNGILFNYNWQIKVSTLQSCFLSVFKEEPIIITFFNVGKKSIMELKRPIIINSAACISTAKYQYEFPHVERVLASFVLSFENPVIAVIYHDKKSNKCYIKRVSMSSI